jgi:hypothetical protein
MLSTNLYFDFDPILSTRVSQPASALWYIHLNPNHESTVTHRQLSSLEHLPVVIQSRVKFPHLGLVLPRVANLNKCVENPVLAVESYEIPQFLD